MVPYPYGVVHHDELRHRVGVLGVHINQIVKCTRWALRHGHRTSIPAKEESVWFDHLAHREVRDERRDNMHQVDLSSYFTHLAFPIKVAR